MDIIIYKYLIQFIYLYILYKIDPKTAELLFMVTSTARMIDDSWLERSRGGNSSTVYEKKLKRYRNFVRAASHLSIYKNITVRIRGKNIWMSNDLEIFVIFLINMQKSKLKIRNRGKSK